MAIVHQRGWVAAGYAESRWYAALRAPWQQFAGHRDFPTPAELSELYTARVMPLCDLPEPARQLRFVAAAPKKKRRRAPVELATLYEGRIIERGEVPTRERDWHDFFNALTFIAFPRAKWALHRRQYQLLKARIGERARRLPGARTREQDALALFDEGGIVLAVEPASLALLEGSSDSFEANVLALCERGAARAVPFGHALPEHLVERLSCPLGTVHVIPKGLGHALDSALYEQLDRALFLDLSATTHFVTPSPARGMSLHALAQAEARAPQRP